MEIGIISIHQPNLFPRIKVLKKIFNSDIYVPITGSNSKLLIIGILFIIGGAAFLFYGKTSEKRFN